VFKGRKAYNVRAPNFSHSVMFVLVELKQFKNGVQSQIRANYQKVSFYSSVHSPVLDNFNIFTFGINVIENS
jgi:hypothetical protein